MSDSQVTSLEQYAESSNSKLVYAHDEIGNDIAVGVFVTEDFNVNIIENKDEKEEKYSTEDINSQPNITWVVAVEECHGQKTEGISLEAECDDTKEHTVRVYQVNKKKKYAKKKLSQPPTLRKTLRELKKCKILPVKQDVCMKRRARIRKIIPQDKGLTKKSKHKVRKVIDRAY